MKLTMKLLSTIFAVLLLVNVANAESPREQLKQMVEQLQTNPSDSALREKIIKLAQELKPAPAVPDEAERRMVRGTAAFKGAKSVADYQDAVKEFEQATLTAPWYGDAYFNLGVAQDKAENYEAALRSLKLSQLVSPDNKEIKTLMYEVEYRNEKARSPDVLAERQRKRNEELAAQFDGAQWHKENNSRVSCMDAYIELHHGEVFSGWIVVNPNGTGCPQFDVPGQGWVKAWLGKAGVIKRVRLEGLNFDLSDENTTLMAKISEDGERITITFSLHEQNYTGTETYTRVKNPRWSLTNGQ
ncbi:MAG: tetratricopeptide repeat protein [Betaproteobacteria bacterium]|nr:tetratricopeptide repeat protein [Betaproteobacteria bacterium]